MDRLYRSRKSRVIGGVAGGFGEYLNIDPVIIRILLVVFTLIHGLGLLLYIIMWIVIPEQPLETAGSETGEIKSEPAGSEKKADGSSNTGESAAKSNSRIVFGIVLIGAGVIFLADRFIPSICFEDLFPLSLVIIGIALIWNSLKK